MPNDVVQNIKTSIGTRAEELFTNILHRVDSFHIPGYGVFYWGWHISDCNGLQDKIWKGSNGRDLGHVIENDILRLVGTGAFKNGGVSIDVGAHTGDSTLPMAILSNMTIAFDPGSSVFPILEANALLNSDRNIHAHNLAVGDHDGDIKFQYDGENRGIFQCNGGIAGREDRVTESAWVTKKMVNLEPFLLKTYGTDTIRKIVYIKTDAEGYDSTILHLIHQTIIKKYDIHPTIQVEWFRPFSRGDDAGVLPTGGSSDLFQIIYELIQQYNYIAHCTGQCNSPKRQCHRQLYPLTVSENNGTISVLCPDRPNVVNSDACDDILLIPKR